MTQQPKKKLVQDYILAHKEISFKKENSDENSDETIDFPIVFTDKSGEDNDEIPFRGLGRDGKLDAKHFALNSDYLYDTDGYGKPSISQPLKYMQFWQHVDKNVTRNSGGEMLLPQTLNDMDNPRIDLFDIKLELFNTPSTIPIQVDATQFDKMKNIIQVMKTIKPSTKEISPFIEYRTQTVWTDENKFETFVDKANQQTRDEYQFVPLKKFLGVMFNDPNRKERVKKLINMIACCITVTPEQGDLIEIVCRLLAYNLRFVRAVCLFDDIDALKQVQNKSVKVIVDEGMIGIHMNEKKKIDGFIVLYSPKKTRQKQTKPLIPYVDLSVAYSSKPESRKSIRDKNGDVIFKTKKETFAPFGATNAYVVMMALPKLDGARKFLREMSLYLVIQQVTNDELKLFYDDNILEEIICDDKNVINITKSERIIFSFSQHIKQFDKITTNDRLYQFGYAFTDNPQRGALVDTTPADDQPSSSSGSSSTFPARSQPSPPENATTTRIRRLEDDKKQLEEENEQLKNNREHLTDIVEQQKNDITELKKSVSTLTTEKEQCETDLSRSTTEIRELNTKLVELKNDNTNLKTKADDFKTQRDACKNDLKEHKNKLNQLQQDYDNTNETLKEIKTEHIRLEEYCEKVLKEKIDLEIQLDKLKAKHAAPTAPPLEKNSPQAQVNKGKEKLPVATAPPPDNTMIEELKKEIQTKDNEINFLKKAIEECNEQKEELEKQKNGLKISLEVQKITIERQRKEIREKKNFIDWGPSDFSDSDEDEDFFTGEDSSSEEDSSSDEDSSSEDDDDDDDDDDEGETRTDDIKLVSDKIAATYSTSGLREVSQKYSWHDQHKIRQILSQHKRDEPKMFKDLKERIHFRNPKILPNSHKMDHEMLNAYLFVLGSNKIC